MGGRNERKTCKMNDSSAPFCQINVISLFETVKAGKATDSVVCPFIPSTFHVGVKEGVFFLTTCLLSVCASCLANVGFDTLILIYFLYLN